MSSFSNKPLQESVAVIWAATLEVWVHQILFVRRVYPLETFGPAEYQGITTCKVCRHPEVVSYIHDTVETAVPALLGGTATELSLRIVERDAVTETIAMEWEVYTLRMLNIHLALAEQIVASDATTKAELLLQLERGLRNLILKVQGLSHGHVTSSVLSLDQLSFELTLKVPNEDPSCVSLQEGFDKGTWNETTPFTEEQKRRPPNDTKTARVLRPLHLVETELCRLDFSLIRNQHIQVPSVAARHTTATTTTTSLVVEEAHDDTAG